METKTTNATTNKAKTNAGGLRWRRTTKGNLTAPVEGGTVTIFSKPTGELAWVIATARPNDPTHRPQLRYSFNYFETEADAIQDALQEIQNEE